MPSHLPATGCPRCGTHLTRDIDDPDDDWVPSNAPTPAVSVADGLPFPVRPLLGIAALALIIAVAWVFLPGSEKTQIEPPAQPLQGGRSEVGLSSSSTAAAEGLPVPASARSGDLRPDPFGPGGTTSYTVDGVSTSDVIAWYQDRVPYGSNFGGWPWCSTSDDYQLGKPGSYRSWAQGGFLLELTINDTVSGDGTLIEIALKTVSEGCNY